MWRRYIFTFRWVGFSNICLLKRFCELKFLRVFPEKIHFWKKTNMIPGPLILRHTQRSLGDLSSLDRASLPTSITGAKTAQSTSGASQLLGFKGKVPQKWHNSQGPTHVLTWNTPDFCVHQEIKHQTCRFWYGLIHNQSLIYDHDNLPKASSPTPSDPKGPQTSIQGVHPMATPWQRLSIQHPNPSHAAITRPRICLRFGGKEEWIGEDSSILQVTNQGKKKSHV